MFETSPRTEKYKFVIWQPWPESSSFWVWQQQRHNNWFVAFIKKDDGRFRRTKRCWALPLSLLISTEILNTKSIKPFRLEILWQFCLKLAAATFLGAKNLVSAPKTNFERKQSQLSHYFISVLRLHQRRAKLNSCGLKSSFLQLFFKASFLKWDILWSD